MFSSNIFNHAEDAPKLQIWLLVCWFSALVQTKISIKISASWDAVRFYTVQTFTVPSGRNIPPDFSSSSSTNIGWIEMNSVTDIHGAQTIYPTDFGDPLISPLELCLKCLVNYWTDYTEIWYTHSCTSQEELY